MSPDILAIFIPIIFLIGLFSVIALNIIAKYKSKAMIANRVESIEEWHKTEARAKIVKAEARAARKHGTGLRICGLLVGIGLGTAIGCTVLACGGISDDHAFSVEAIATFLVISLSMVFGGAGMIGAYFLQRKLDGKSN